MNESKVRKCGYGCFKDDDDDDDDDDGHGVEWICCYGELKIATENQKLTGTGNAKANKKTNAATLPKQ